MYLCGSWMIIQLSVIKDVFKWFMDDNLAPCDKRCIKLFMDDYIALCDKRCYFGSWMIMLLSVVKDVFVDHE